MRQRRQRGVALVLVLLVTTLLTVVAASFAFSMRSDTLMGQNAVAAARAETLADAAVQRALFELFKPASDQRRWLGDGVAHPWDFDGAKIDITIEDISARIDLNSAADALLKGLLQSIGLDEERSSALLDAILDWRDSDDLRRLHGAEAADYKAAGLSYGPSNAPFATVDELQRVLGVTPALYAKLADALTVDSHQAGVNMAIASRKTLLAIPGVDPPAVDAYLALRRDALAAAAPVPPFPYAAGFMAGANGSVYSVRAAAALPDGAAFIREAVIRIATGAATQRIAILSWKEGTRMPRPDGGEMPVADEK